MEATRDDFTRLKWFHAMIRDSERLQHNYGLNREKCIAKINEINRKLNGEKLNKPETLQRLETIQRELRNVRDYREAVPCIEDEACLRDNFDRIIDSIDDLVEEIKNG